MGLALAALPLRRRGTTPGARLGLEGAGAAALERLQGRVGLATVVPAGLGVALLLAAFLGVLGLNEHVLEPLHLLLIARPHRRTLLSRLVAIRVVIGRRGLAGSLGDGARRQRRRANVIVATVVVIRRRRPGHARRQRRVVVILLELLLELKLAGDLDVGEVLAVLVAEDVLVPPLAAGAAAAADGHVLHRRAGRQLVLGDAADAHRGELVVARVDDVGRAEALVTRLLPLRRERAVDDAVAHAVVVDLTADTAVLIVHIVDVARPLPVDLVHGPQPLVLAVAIVALVDALADLVLQRVQRRLDDLEALGNAPAAPELGHG
mmetsp:Transcript_14246/g.42650  ORF Transcript_14246/g.42650 Transcript_14246/m.42650 type:complete len:321 (+) Transcript_14246:212-1174(+)